MKNTVFVALVAVVLTVPLSYAGYGTGKNSSKKTTKHQQFNEQFQGIGDYEDSDDLDYQLNLPEDEEIEGEAATAHDSNPVGMIQQNSGYGFEEGIARY